MTRRVRRRAQDDRRDVRRQVAALHAELTRYGLVVWTAGNVSARVPGADLFVIKPSPASRYDELTADNMVVCDLDGELVDGDLSPSQRHRGARLRLPAHAARSAASCTPTPRTRPPGPRAASRSRAC